MGSSLTASCECGYTTGQLMVGGGIQTFKTTYIFPAFCRDCQDLVATNLLDEQPKCEHCGSDRAKAYGDESLQGEAGSEVIVSWGHPANESGVTISNGTYLCPSCGEFQLRFEQGGIRWD